MVDIERGWRHALAVIEPVLWLGPEDLLDSMRVSARANGVAAAVCQHATAALFNWMVRLASYQGISDRIALAFDTRHGGIGFADIEAALGAEPGCPLLRSYWTFADCRFRKAAWTCARPDHLAGCPLPRHPLRKGSLNVAAYALWLFLRDVCTSDLVGWIDGQLAAADDHGRTRADRMRTALLDPLVEIAGIGPKLWSMVLADLLLGGDPRRERWTTTGASFVVIDTLVHNFLARTGVLRRLGAEHYYGPACYAPNGCAEVIRGLSVRIDARRFNPAFPADFPRFVTASIWAFCAAGGLAICNGLNIDDRAGCAQPWCPAGPMCDRLALASP